jgi:hypothetical protein
MKLKYPAMAALTLGLVASSASAASYFQNFDGFADGTTDLGDGTQMNGSASIQGDRLRLSQDGGAGGFGSFNVPALANSSSGWAATFSLTVADSVGANEPADGFSFNYGNFALGELGSAEEGMDAIASVTENLSFEIDTWMNLDAEQGVNVGQKTGGVTSDLAFTNGSILADGTSVSGTATISWDPINGASFTTTGLLTNADFADLPTTFAASDDLLFGLSSRVGGANQDVFIDDLRIITIPEPSGTILLGLGSFGLLLRRRR